MIDIHIKIDYVRIHTCLLRKDDDLQANILRMQF